MTFIEIYAIGGLVLLGLMSTLWIISLLLRNTSIVDIFWGGGFIVVHWVYFALTPDGFATRKLLISVLLMLWGLRISTYLLWRMRAHGGEDYRYAKMHKRAGSSWWWQSYLSVFILQGTLIWLISAPLLAAQISPAPNTLTLLDTLAIVVWLVGFYFEAVGDLQLARFKADPTNKGVAFDQGVWRYTRHPNYFGDDAQWFAFYLIAAATPDGFLTIWSPLILTWMLLRLSGVTLLERTLTRTKSGYTEYVENTSAFIPWFPRK